FDMSDDDVVTLRHQRRLSVKFGSLAQIIAYKDPFPDLATVRSMVATEELRLRSRSSVLPTGTTSSAPQVGTLPMHAGSQSGGLNVSQQQQLLQLLQAQNPLWPNLVSMAYQANLGPQLHQASSLVNSRPNKPSAHNNRLFSRVLYKVRLQQIGHATLLPQAFKYMPLRNPTDANWKWILQPPGFRDSQHPDHVCLLQRSLYGLKQAPRAWFQRFAAYAARYALELLGACVACSLVILYRTPVDTDLWLYADGDLWSDTTYIASLCGAFRI
ncbi:ribonuclease H-like domain-containing protein, partial [Tanacetum coccineum]